MINIGKKCLAALLAASMVFGVTGCGRQKKAKKPYVQSTAEVKNGTAKAEGKGKQHCQRKIKRKFQIYGSRMEHREIRRKMVPS